MLKIKIWPGLARLWPYSFHSRGMSSNKKIKSFCTYLHILDFEAMKVGQWAHFIKQFLWKPIFFWQNYLTLTSSNYTKVENMTKINIHSLKHGLWTLWMNDNMFIWSYFIFWIVLNFGRFWRILIHSAPVGLLKLMIYNV